MGKYSSKEAQYARLRVLAEVNKPQTKESRTIGTLINFTRGADGVAYGIIKENHNYYLKKGGKKNSPDASDFTYIGGLENITNYQYKSISEAEKQRNLILIEVNGATRLRTNKTNSKMFLNEDVADDEIEQAKSEIPDLDAATAAENSPEMGMDGDTEPKPEIPDLGDNDTIPSPGEEPTGGSEGGLDAPAGADSVPTGEEMPDMGGEEAGGEMPDMGGETGEEMPDMGGEETAGEMGGDDDVNVQITKALGKLTNTIRKTETTPVETKSYLNTFIAAFKDKLPDVEIEDRKEMANKLIKILDNSESDLESSMPDEPVAEEVCAECGGFGGFAEANGYSKEAFMECDNTEKASLISRYKTSEEDGENANDDDTIALFANDEIAESLSNDYGHEKYVSEVLKPQIMKMSEGSEEDKTVKINELSWGGIKNAASSIGSGIKNAVSGVGSGAVKDFGKNVAKGVSDIGAGMKQGYNKGVQNDKVAELTKLADELKQKIDALNAATVKAGGEPIEASKVIGILQAKLGDSVPSNIANNKGASAAWSNRNAANLNTLKIKEGETMPVDAGNIEVKPNVIQENDDDDLDDTKPDEIESEPIGDEATESPEMSVDEPTESPEMSMEEPSAEPEFSFAPEAQNLGVAGLTSKDATVDINVDANAKTLNIKLNEAIKALNEISTGLANRAASSAYSKNDNSLATNDPIASRKLSTQRNKFMDYTNPEIVNGLKAFNIGVAKDNKDVVLFLPDNVNISVTPRGYEIVRGTVDDINDSLMRKVQYYIKLIQKDLSTTNNSGVTASNELEEMNESEKKIRKYIRTRLEEVAGLRKPSLNENAKSEKLKNLDKLIESQFSLFKSEIVKKK